MGTDEIGRVHRVERHLLQARRQGTGLRDAGLVQLDVGRSLDPQREVPVRLAVTDPPKLLHAPPGGSQGAAAGRGTIPRVGAVPMGRPRAGAPWSDVQAARASDTLPDQAAGARSRGPWRPR